MLIQIAFAIMLLCLILLIPHGLLYLTINYCFHLPTPGAKWTVFLVLSLLAIQLPVTVVLLRVTRASWLNHLVYLGSVWYGFFTFLLIAIMLFWLLMALSHWFHWTVPPRLTVIILISLAAMVTGYSLRQGATIHIKPMTISIKDLPDFWQNKTIVHLTDVHLGPILSTTYLEQLTALLDTIAPDLILITGDLFDGMNGSLDMFLPGLKKIKAKEGVYFVTGNHEGYLGLSEPLAVIKQSGIKVLDYEIVSLQGLQLIGIPFPEHDRPNLTADLFSPNGPYDPGQPSILLYHTPTNIFEGQKKDRGDQQMKTYWSPDTSLASVKTYGIDLQLSGHTHQGQIWPFTWLTPLIFAKRDYGLHQDGNFQLYTSSGTGTWGPPMRLGSQSELVVITVSTD